MHTGQMQSTQTRLGSMRFGECTEALLGAHFPLCAKEIKKSLESKDGNYALAYDQLLRVSKKRKLESSWGEAMQRAQTLTADFVKAEKENVNLREYWSCQWNDSYEGFCKVRDELGDLRETVFQGNLKKSQKQETLRNLLNRMLRSNAREWFSAWGELDLHRLSPNDALQFLHRCVCVWMWDEVRIISGQRAHNSGHISKGTLFNLIHSITGRANPEASKFDASRLEMINDTKLFIQKNKVEVFYYSEGGALLLKRPEEAQRKYLRDLEWAPHVRRSLRRGSFIPEVDGKWQRASAGEMAKIPIRQTSFQKPRRTTRSRISSRCEAEQSPKTFRRSSRLAEGLQKSYQT